MTLRAGSPAISSTDIEKGRAVESILIRNLPEGTKARLEVRAGRNHRSMEAEAREILRESLRDRRGGNVGTWIHKQLADLGLDELELPPRNELPRVPDLDQ